MVGADAMALQARRVLVLGSDTRAFLSVVRSLGRRGIAVDVAWCPADSPARRSRYISSIHDLPSYRLDDSAWLTRLVELVGSRPFDLVIPCDDPTTLPLQAHRDELEPHGSFYLLSPRAFETTMSKRRTHELAQQLGIPLPRQEVVSSPAELEAAAARLGYPLVLKPDSPFTRGNLLSRRTHVKIRSSMELAAAAQRVPAIAQKHIIGDGIGVSVLAAEGTILVAFQHRREHEPLIGGGSAYRSSMPVDPRLFEACAKLMAELAYTGVAMVEFKVDPRTKQWILIEVNGRFWGSLPLALAAGVDFPYYLYELLVHGRRDFPTQYRTPVYCRNLSLDFSWTIDNLRANRSDPILMTKPLRQVARDAVRLVTLREHNDTLTRDDPAPGLVETWKLARTILAHRHEALATQAVEQPAIRKVARALAARRLRDAKSIVVVGNGNIYRSPFAQRYFASKCVAGVETESAGCLPERGRPVPAEAVETAARFGVDLRDHRSRVLSAEMLVRADVIWIFDRNQRRFIEKEFPTFRHKLHYLGMFDPRGGVIIKDRRRKDAGALVEAYAAIARAVDVATAEIERAMSLRSVS